MAEIRTVPREYGGVTFRSSLERDWAATLDHYNIEWSYEPQTIELPSGAGYVPDFWLPRLRTFIEVKGAGVPRRYKPEELATVLPPDDRIVLIGYEPLRRSNVPFLWESYLQWGDPLGYDTRLARCPQCSAWQWIRAQLSRQCRVCGTTHYGCLAKSGEMAFESAEPRLSWILSLRQAPPLPTRQRGDMDKPWSRVRER